MAISLLYGCCQIETASRDLAATRGFMEGVLGAGKIEQELAGQIRELFPDGGYDVDHLDCGEGVFQINEPSDTMNYGGKKSIHQAYLDRIGPCVTNLNFFIDDHAHAKQLLTALGAEVHIEGPSSAARGLADYGPDNTRPGADDRPFLFMGTRHLLGLDLEIMEPNFLRFADQTTQFPCFVQPRPAVTDGNLLLQRLRLVVPDLEAAWANIEAIFTPGSRSKPYAQRSGRLGKSFRIGLSGIELEYCQPLSGRGELAGELEKYGPGVVAVAFAANSPGKVKDMLAGEGKPGIAAAVDPLDGTVQLGHHRIACRELTGFDVILEKGG